MDTAIKAILTSLLNKKIIGGKHTPEHNIIVSKTKWLGREEQKEFEREYKQLINNEVILRLKKRTGKGYDWHISLNPRKLNELYGILE